MSSCFASLHNKNNTKRVADALLENSPRIDHAAGDAVFDIDWDAPEIDAAIERVLHVLLAADHVLLADAAKFALPYCHCAECRHVLIIFVQQVRNALYKDMISVESAGMSDDSDASYDMCDSFGMLDLWGIQRAQSF